VSGAGSTEPQRGEPVVDRDELQAAIAARQELGGEREPELVEAFVARIERRLADRPPAKATRSGGADWGAVVLGIASLVFAIPLLAVAGNAGGLAILAVAVLLVVVNGLYHARAK
jgi:hypothetical protein